MEPAAEQPESHENEGLGGEVRKARSLDDIVGGFEQLEEQSKVPKVNPEELENLKIGQGALSSLIASTERFLSLVDPDKNLAANQDAHLSERLAELCRTVDAVVSLYEAINFVGNPSNPRTSEAAQALVFPVARHIKAKANALPDELRLLNTLIRSGSVLKRTPTWMKAERVLNVYTTATQLPGPDKYFAALETSPQEAKPLLEKHADVLKAIQKEKDSRSGDSEVMGGLTDQRVKLEARLDKILESLVVDPAKVSELGKTIGLKVAPNHEFVAAIGSTYRALSKLISDSVLGVATGQTTQQVKFPGVAKHVDEQKPGSTIIYAEKPVELPSSLNVREDSKTFLQALETLLSLRRAFESFAGFLSQAPLAPDKQESNFRKDMLGILGAVFGETEKTAEVISALLKIDVPGVPEAAARVITCKTFQTSSSIFESPLTKTENFSLYQSGVKTLLTGTDVEKNAVKPVFTSGQLGQTLEYADKVQRDLSEGRFKSIARLIDDDLARLAKEGDIPFHQRAVLLTTLRALVDQPKACSMLKGRLKNTKLIGDVAALLQKGVKGEQSNAAKTIEASRAYVTRKLLPDLSDYWGQRENVKRIKGIMDSNLKILENPDEWDGLPAHKVLMNGILTYGDPGVGKTYLTKCAANDYGVPLVTVTREEMAQAFEAAGRVLERESEKRTGADTKESKVSSKESGSGVETALADFLETKIKQATRDMDKSGAKFCILLIDEMEAEFQNRDPKTSPRSELARTNIMLRVIERLMEQHPRVLFWANTNHFEQVDSAAKRVGRFGLHFHLELPGIEDAKEILEGNLTQLGFALSTQDTDSEGFKKLLEAAKGVPPKVITDALNHRITLMRIDNKGKELKLDSAGFVMLAEQVEFLKKCDHRGKIEAENSDEE